MIDILPFAEGLAHQAGEILMGYYGQIHQIEHKSPGDVVTEADKASEQFVTETIQAKWIIGCQH